MQSGPGAVVAFVLLVADLISSMVKSVSSGEEKWWMFSRMVFSTRQSIAERGLVEGRAPTGMFQSGMGQAKVQCRSERRQQTHPNLMYCLQLSQIEIVNCV